MRAFRICWVCFLITACKTTTVEIENVSGCDLKVDYLVKAAKSSRTPKSRTRKNRRGNRDTNKNQTESKAQYESYSIAAGQSEVVRVNAPVFNETAKINFTVTGPCYVGPTSTEVNVGEANSMKLEANAGMLAVTNSSQQSMSFKIAQVRDASMLLGFGKWGDSYGPIKPGETKEVGPFKPANNYWINGGGKISGPHHVKVGETGKVSLRRGTGKTADKR